MWVYGRMMNIWFSTIFSLPNIISPRTHINNQEYEMKRTEGNHPAFTFPEIKTTRNMEQRLQKILDEVKEYETAETDAERDQEAVDILHSVETFLRGRFAGREFRLSGIIAEVYNKNKKRGYYDTDCF